MNDDVTTPNKSGLRLDLLCVGSEVGSGSRDKVKKQG